MSHTTRLFLSFACFYIAAANAQTDPALKALSKDAWMLKGLRVEAHTMAVTYGPKNPAANLLKETASKPNLSKQEMEAMQKLQAFVEKQRTLLTTNTASFVYQFQPGTIAVRSKESDTQGPRQATITLASNDVIYRSVTYLKPASSGKKLGPSGSIQWRTNKALVPDVPVFLSRTLLRELVDSSRDVHVTPTNHNGIDCTAIHARPENTPVAYLILLESSDGTPLEFQTFYNGRHISSTILTFDNSGDFPFLCRRAESRSYSQGRLFQEKTWVLDSVSNAGEPLVADVAEIFRIGTEVSDQRFGKPLSYSVGSRLPTDAEIKGMLSDMRGIVRYHLATMAPANSKKVSLLASPLRRRLVLAVLVVFAVLAAALILKALAGQRRHR